LKESISKWGRSNFTREILHILSSEEEMRAKEAAIVDESLLEDPLCLNRNLGGVGSWHHVHRKGLHKLGAKMSGDLSRGTKLQGDNLINARRALALARQHADNRGNTTWVGRKHSEETKSKMSLSKKGKNLGEKNHQFGSRWINKEGKAKKVPGKDLQTWLDNGWSLGRSSNLS
jgi:hypothetical protein